MDKKKLKNNKNNNSVNYSTPWFKTKKSFILYSVTVILAVISIVVSIQNTQPNTETIEQNIDVTNSSGTNYNQNIVVQKNNGTNIYIFNQGLPVDLENNILNITTSEIENLEQSPKMDEKDKELLDKGVIAKRNGNHNLALTYFENLEKKYPTNEIIKNYVGLSYGELDNYEEAIIHFDEAISINPNFHVSYENKIMALIFSNDEITDTVKDYLVLEKTNPRFLEQVYTLSIFTGRENIAILVKEKLLEDNPNDVQILLGKGYAEHKSGLLEKAKTTYSKILLIDKYNPDALYASALIFAQLDNEEASLDFIDRFLDLEPHNPAILDLKADVEQDKEITVDFEFQGIKLS